MGTVGEQAAREVLPAGPGRRGAGGEGGARLAADGGHARALLRGQGLVMRRLRALWVRATSLFGRARRERELDEELASPLEMHAEDPLPAGASHRPTPNSLPTLICSPASFLDTIQVALLPRATPQGRPVRW